MMSFWDKVRFAFSSRESTINSRAEAIVSACGQGVSDSKALETLKEVAELTKMPVPLFNILLDDNSLARSDQELKDIYIVALAGSILQLLKEDTRLFPREFSATNEAGREMRRQEQTRLAVDWQVIDESKLREALNESRRVKVAWENKDHPCWNVNRFLDMEICAQSQVAWADGLRALKRRLRQV